MHTHRGRERMIKQAPYKDFSLVKKHQVYQGYLTRSISKVKGHFRQGLVIDAA